jgi:hypothetical protein
LHLGLVAAAWALLLAAAPAARADEVRPVQGMGRQLGIGADRFRSAEEARAVRTSWSEDARFGRGAGRSLRVEFDPAVHPTGALGLEVPPLRAGEGVALWVYAEACGARLWLRLYESDGDRWEHPAVQLDFTGWREFRLDQTTTRFVPKHRTRQDWHRIQQLQVALEGAPCRVYLGDLRFVPRDTTPPKP